MAQKEIKALRKRIDQDPWQQEVQEIKRKLQWMEETEMAVVVSQEQNEIQTFKKWRLDITPHREKMESWMNGLKAEFKKIIWPDQKSLVKQTGAVVAVSIVLGVMIALLDFIFQYGVDILVNISF